MNKKSGINLKTPNRLWKALKRATGYGRERQALQVKENLTNRWLESLRVKGKDIPDVFFHGAQEGSVKSILKKGLKPNYSSRAGSHSVKGEAYAGNSVFLSKDPSYASMYGKNNEDGLLDWEQVPNLLRVILPKKYNKKVKDIMKQKNIPMGGISNTGVELAGVGTYKIGPTTIGVGSEFAHKGKIDPKFIARSESKSKKLQAKAINEAVRDRGIDYGKRVSRVDEIIEDIRRRKSNTNAVVGATGLSGTGYTGYKVGQISATKDQSEVAQKQDVNKQASKGISKARSEEPTDEYLPKAVIIKGSPRYINGNPVADKFYEDLSQLVRDAGYTTSYDAGEPYTLPDETADLWVAHSRGQDRLRFAPKGMKTLAIDQFEDRAAERRAINAKLMEAAGAKSWAEWEDRPDPPAEHYQITDALRNAIKEVTGTNVGVDKKADSEEPTMLGKGLIPFLADTLPFMPSGARRAGAAKVMNARMGKNSPFYVDNPMASQVGSLLGGGALGMYLSERMNPGDVESRAKGALVGGVGALGLIQLLKAYKIRSAGSEYEDFKGRKRLRELDDEDIYGTSPLDGSANLGARQAYESMRKRKYQGLSGLSESMDALPLVMNGVAPGSAILSTPITSAVDYIESRKMKKRAAADEHYADEDESTKDKWYSQRKSPVIPGIVLAGILGDQGRRMSSNVLGEAMAGMRPMPKNDWSELSQHISGRNPLTATAPGLIGNAFFAAGETDNPERTEELARFLNAIQAKNTEDPWYNITPWTNFRTKAKMKRLAHDGVILADPNLSSAVIAHEGGHAKINAMDGTPLKWLQDHAYRYSPLVAPLASVAALGTGLSSKSTVGGALKGTGIGLLATMGQMAPEAMASYYGLKGLDSFQGGKYKNPTDRSDLLKALGTYAAFNVLPSTISGALGGFIAARRKRKKKKDAQKA